MATAELTTGTQGAMVETMLTETVATIFVRGDLDSDAIPAVAEAIARSVSRARPGVVLDLGDVAFVDVTGLEFIVRARRRLTKSGGTLTVRRPTPEIHRLLAVCGIVDLDLSSRSTPPSRAPDRPPETLVALAPDIEWRYGT